MTLKIAPPTLANCINLHLNDLPTPSKASQARPAIRTRHPYEVAHIGASPPAPTVHLIECATTNFMSDQGSLQFLPANLRLLLLECYVIDLFFTDLMQEPLFE